MVPGAAPHNADIHLIYMIFSDASMPHAIANTIIFFVGFGITPRPFGICAKPPLRSPEGRLFDASK